MAKSLLFSMVIILILSPLSFATTILFQQDMSAQFLLDNADFPNTTRQPTSVNGGTALDFGAGDLRGKLIELPLLAAGQIPLSGPTTVSFSMTATPLSSDNDLAFAVSDGTNVVGFMRADNSGGMGIVYTSTETGGPSVVLDAHDIVFTGAGLPITFSGDIILDTSTRVSGVINSSTVTEKVAGLTIDRTKALKLLIPSDNAEESYRIHSISVTITTDAVIVPEPSSFIFLSLGVLGIVLRKNH